MTCRPREIFPNGTRLQMQEAEAVGPTVSGGVCWDRPLMSHLKTDCRKWRLKIAGGCANGW